MAVAIASVAVLVATAAPALAGVDDDGDAADWLGSLYGKWRLSSVVVDGKQYKCPATYGQTGSGTALRCTAHDKLVINADHTYTRTPKMFPWSTTRGEWAAWNGLIAFDDHDADADPQAYRFKLKARELWIYKDLENPADWQQHTHVVQKWVRAS